MEKFEQYGKMEKIACLLRLAENQILIPLHIKSVCRRELYYELTLFRKDKNKFTGGMLLYGEVPMNQFMLTFASTGRNAGLQGLTYKGNGELNILARSDPKNKFVTTIGNATGFQGGTGTEVGVVKMPAVSNNETVHIASVDRQEMTMSWPMQLTRHCLMPARVRMMLKKLTQ